MKIVKYAASLLIVSLFVGCGGAKPTPEKTDTKKATPAVSKTAQFKIGKTTKSDVIAALGQPNGFSLGKNGTETLSYYSVKSTGKSWIPFYFGHDNVRTTQDVLQFKNSILSNMSHEESHY